MDTDGFIEALRAGPDYRDQIVHAHRQPGQAAQYADPRHPLSERGRRMLEALGISRLYSHQAEALDAARAGQDVLIVTGTASGKTLAYLLPIIETLERDPEARVVALYPTKALAQDQARVFERALGAAGLAEVSVAVLDGDTPSEQRRRARDQARVLITNPDMLHAAILPQHARWGPVLARLGYLVVDELHTYTGLFGANVANLFRRLERLFRLYGSQPRLMACSATIGNPAELGRRLTGRDLTLIERDGSPRGARTYLFWNPPQIRERLYRSRRSANVEAQELMVALLLRGAPTIAFSKAKVTAELIYRYVREALAAAAPALADRVTPYRGGYLPVERRQIEQRLFAGELLGVSTTRALELGIDVGGLDASVIVGYPGTLASFFQQGGRAGRRGQDSLVVLVGLDTAVNQYVMRHPEYIFGRPLEQGVVDADNPFVLLGQLRCACHEQPLADAELPDFGEPAGVVLDILSEQHKVLHREGAWYHAAVETPQHEVSLRDYADRNVVIIDASDGDRVIGEVNKYDAQPILHPEAIYLHQGETYLVESLDLERYQCRVRRVEVDYYTQPLGGTDVHHVDHPLREKPFGTGRLLFGEVTAFFRTFAYERIRFYTLDAISRHPLDLPNFVLETHAFWIVPDEATCNRALATGLDPHAGLRGIGYATRMILPLFVRCETLDFSHSIGALNAPWQAVFVYERYPHGLGFTRKAYERAHQILPAVLDHVRRCECDDGCPCCVGKPLRQYTTWNVERGEAHIPSKRAAVFILQALLGDGSRLEEPDRQRLEDGPAADRLELERSLRRRLEAMREPIVFHPVEHGLQTGYPQPEERPTLSTADVARRAFRRRRFDTAMRGVTLSATGEPREPLSARTLARLGPDAPLPPAQSPAAAAAPATAVPIVPCPPPAAATGTPPAAGDGRPPVVAGHDLASRARKRRQARPPGEGEIGPRPG